MSEFEKQDQEVMGSDGSAACGGAKRPERVAAIGERGRRSATDENTEHRNRETTNFEMQDREAMNLVNKGKWTIASSTADAVPLPQRGRLSKECTKGKYLAPDPEADAKAELKRQWLLTAIKLALCACCIVIFVGILKEPEMVPAVANIGVACFVGAAAVILDRAIGKR